MGAEAEDDPPQAATHASAQHPDDGAADRPAAAHRRPRTSPEQRAAQSAWCDRSSIPRDSHFFVKNPQNAQVTFERDSLGALRRRVVWPHDGSATPWNMGEGVDLRPEMPRIDANRAPLPERTREWVEKASVPNGFLARDERIEKSFSTVRFARDDEGSLQRHVLTPDGGERKWKMMRDTDAERTSPYPTIRTRPSVSRARGEQVIDWCDRHSVPRVRGMPELKLARDPNWEPGTPCTWVKPKGSKK